MSEFKAPCGCQIHVAQWTSKRKVASVKYCSLHGASKDLLDMLKEVVPYLDEDHEMFDRVDSLIAKVEGHVAEIKSSDDVWWDRDTKLESIE
jgi:hypothetical protein